MSSRLEQAVDHVRAGRVRDLFLVLGASPDVVNDRDAEGRTLLIFACNAVTNELALPPRAGTPAQLEAVQVILSAGADPAAAADNGWAPLHAAGMTGHVPLAELLLGAGAPRSGRLHGTTGGSPLSLALFYAKTACANLLAAPASPDSLRSAAGLGRDLNRFFDGDELRPESAAGSDFYAPALDWPEWQRTLSRQELLDEALVWSARNGQVESLTALRARGADVNSNPHRGTPLLWAIYDDRVEAARWLLDHGADPDLTHDFGGPNHGKAATAMHLAAQYESLQCLRLLIERGADPTIRDGAFDGTPRDWAEHMGARPSLALFDELGH